MGLNDSKLRARSHTQVKVQLKLLPTLLQNEVVLHKFVKLVVLALLFKAFTALFI
jgi:hypothetical protein